MLTTLFQLNLGTVTQPGSGAQPEHIGDGRRHTRRTTTSTRSNAPTDAQAQARDALAKVQHDGLRETWVEAPRGDNANIGDVLRQLEASLQADTLFGKQSAAEAELQAQIAEEDELIAILVAGDLI